ALPRARDLVVVDAARRLPADEVAEHRADRGVTLERDHLRRRVLACALGQARKRDARALEQPAVVDRDLDLRDLEALGEQSHEAREALGRHEHERAKAPALVARPALERGDAVERDEGLADTGLAIED